MGKTCKIINGVLILAAGVVLAMFAYGAMDMKTAHTVAGVAFALVGLHKLASGMGMCQCGNCCQDKGKK